MNVRLTPDEVFILLDLLNCQAEVIDGDKDFIRYKKKLDYLIEKLNKC